ncbi:hypothetical protein D9M68_722700 [compost metagenome]
MAWVSDQHTADAAIAALRNVHAAPSGEVITGVAVPVVVTATNRPSGADHAEPNHR